MAWEISKDIEFCYGHRVWTQNLNKEFALDSQCKCRHRHGHQGTAVVHLGSSALTNSMVTDFKHLNWLKKFMDDFVDHKFILDKNDPLFAKSTGGRKLKPVLVPDTGYVAGYQLDVSDLDPKSAEYEDYSGYFIVDFVPTSENLANWLYGVTQFKMKKIGVSVMRIDWWETPKSKSTFTPAV